MRLGAVGSVVGLRDGLRVGAKVGIRVGLVEGKGVGLRLGFAVGANVGTREGLLEGGFVSFLLGFVVGDTDVSFTCCCEGLSVGEGLSENKVKIGQIRSKEAYFEGSKLLPSEFK